MSEHRITRVRSVMQTKFVAVDGQTTVARALHAMKEANATSLVVEKRHEDDEYGIVLLSDIAKKVIAKDKSIERVSIYEIMSKPVISVGPAMDIRFCFRLFERFGLSVAPVIENGTVIGMINYGSMVFGELIESETS